MDETIPWDSPEWREEGFSGQNACGPWVLERTEGALHALLDELLVLASGQRWAVLPSQLTPTPWGGEAGTRAEHVCAQQMWGPAHFGSQPSCHKTITHTAERIVTQLGDALSLWKRKPPEDLRPTMCHMQMIPELSFCPSGGSNLRFFHSGSWPSPLYSWALSTPLSGVGFTLHALTFGL